MVTDSNAIKSNGCCLPQMAKGSISRVSWKDKVTNKEAKARTREQSIENTLNERRLRWLGHLIQIVDLFDDVFKVKLFADDLKLYTSVYTASECCLSARTLVLFGKLVKNLAAKHFSI